MEVDIDETYKSSRRCGLRWAMATLLLIGACVVWTGCAEDSAADRAQAVDDRRPETFVSDGVLCEDFVSNVVPNANEPEMFEAIRAVWERDDFQEFLGLAGLMGNLSSQVIENGYPEYVVERWFIEWPFNAEFPPDAAGDSYCHGVDEGRTCIWQEPSGCCATTMVCELSDETIGEGGPVYRWEVSNSARACCETTSCPIQCVQGLRDVPDDSPWWKLLYEPCGSSSATHNQSWPANWPEYQCVRASDDPCVALSYYAVSDPDGWLNDVPALKDYVSGPGQIHCMDTTRPELCPAQCAESPAR